MENKIGQNSSEIKQTAEEISTKVEKNGVISAINQTAESIKISADRINLSGYVTASSLTSSGTTVIDGSRITSGTIQGVTIISKNSSGTYVEIDNGFISGGSSAGESGWIEFGGTWDKNPCVNIRGDNLIIGCSKIGVAVTKDGTEIATGSTTQDIKYTIDMDFTLNNDGKNITLTVEKTQKALMFRKGIFIGQRDL
jgi:hypothetical protein